MPREHLCRRVYLASAPAPTHTTLDRVHDLRGSRRHTECYGRPLACRGRTLGQRLVPLLLDQPINVELVVLAIVEVGIREGAFVIPALLFSI